MFCFTLTTFINLILSRSRKLFSGRQTIKGCLVKIVEHLATKEPNIFLKTQSVSEYCTHIRKTTLNE